MIDPKDKNTETETADITEEESSQHVTSDEKPAEDQTEDQGSEE